MLKFTCDDHQTNALDEIKIADENTRTTSLNATQIAYSLTWDMSIATFRTSMVFLDNFEHTLAGRKVTTSNK